LDVFEDEPLESEAGAKFAGLSNLLLTPHIAGVTQESNIRVGAVTVENLRRVLRQSA
jgi:(S)-sulfolactate dehydrogenase